MPGLYLRQRIRLQWPAAAPRITVQAYDPANRPLFDGSGRGAWLVIKGAGEARHLRLTVDGLHIRSYQTAISLGGDRFAEGAFLWDAAIVNNRFERIGSRRPDLKPSTAAVRLVNARDVRIARNQFVSIINDQKCSLLHSIYLAHHSGSNLIEGNTFRDGCGATVKVRDDF